MILAETYTQLVMNVPHILFELTWEAISGIVFYPIARFFISKFRVSFHKEIDVEHGVIHKDS